jgi:hypothetical protein
MAGAGEENWGRKEKSEGEKRRLSRRIVANDAAMVLYCWLPPLSSVPASLRLLRAIKGVN